MVGIVGATAPGAHHRHTGNWLDRAQQHRTCRVIVRVSDDIEALMHAVDQVNVGMTNLAEHGPGTASQARSRVARKIRRAAIGLRLNDPPDGQSAVKEPA